MLLDRNFKKQMFTKGISKIGNPFLIFRVKMINYIVQDIQNTVHLKYGWKSWYLDYALMSASNMEAEP